jgi:hypothetical protein
MALFVYVKGAAMSFVDPREKSGGAVYPTRHKIPGGSRMHVFRLRIGNTLRWAYQGLKSYRAEAQRDRNMVKLEFAARALTDDSQANGGMVMSSVKDVKRRSERLPLTAPIFCLMTVGEGSDHYVEVLNVSNEGVRIWGLSVVSTKPGDDVVLWLNKPERPKTMEVRAVVRWRERQEFGLEFSA